MSPGRSEELHKLTVAQLRERASELEITGRSSMNKNDLVIAVADANEQLSSEASGDGETREDRETQAGEETPQEGGAQDGGGTAPDGEKPASEITAPSIGPNTVIDKKPPQERLDKDKISDVDAMGLDKRRSVVGKRYSASAAKQATLYGAFLLVVAALAIGGKLLADKLDEPDEPAEAKAPWSGNQDPPGAIDFPEYGDT